MKKIDKKNIIINAILSLMIVIFHNTNMDWYLKDVIIPFIGVIISYIYLLNNDIDNKKAYLLLIPIMLILISDLIVKIDISNKILNILCLPILLSIFFLILTNKNYNISGNICCFLFKLFPKGLFSNLTYLKLEKDQKQNKQFSNFMIGLVIGGSIGFVILCLLSSADAYFGFFIANVLNIFEFDPSNLILFIIIFIVTFSVFINILKNKDSKMPLARVNNYDKTTVITILVIIDIIFSLFLLSEISRVTTNFLQIPTEYTYASYAREGFFQLLFVTVINFSIIAFLLYKTKMISEFKNIRWLNIALVLFSIVLIGDSYYRMYLYINHFGFTILRLQVILFLAMELLLFILLLFKINNRLIKNNAKIYFVIMLSFYIANLYLCNDKFISLLNTFKAN